MFRFAQDRANKVGKIYEIYLD